MNKLYEAIVTILQGIMKLWEFIKGKKFDKITADVEEKKRAIDEHDKEVDDKTREKLEDVKKDLGKGEDGAAEAVSAGLDNYFGEEKK